MPRTKKRPAPRRDKWGRFAPRRRNVKLKPYCAPKHGPSGKFVSARIVVRKVRGKRVPHYRTLQKGEWIEVRAYGYYMVIRAVIPRGWMSNYPPTFVSEEPDGTLHQIIWRTPTRLNLFDATELETIGHSIDEGISSAKTKLALAKAYEQEMTILSMELRVLVSPGDSFQVDVWPGTRPPRWLRNER